MAYRPTSSSLLYCFYADDPRTLHPPGGATALIAVTGGTKVASLGYGYVLSPVLSGALILLLTALVFNNITAKRHYPVKYSRLRRSRRRHLKAKRLGGRR